VQPRYFCQTFLTILTFDWYDFPIYKTEIWRYARAVYARLVKILSYHWESVQIVVYRCTGTRQEPDER